MKISNQILGEQAYEIVKEMILSAKLLPGEKIVQDKLAAELGISRTPLRSALQILEAENLIESIPRRGVVVKKFTDEEIVEIYDCRIALEGTATSLFTEKASKKEKDEVANLFSPFQKGSIDLKAYQIVDSIFHNKIMEGSGNKFLAKMFRKSNLLVCINMIGLVRPPEETIYEHIHIIKAIQQGDPKVAQHAMIKHLEKSKDLILARLNAND